MKSYEEFASEFIEALREELPDANIEKYKVPKVNGARDGVSVRFPGSNTAPTVYVEDMFQNHKNGMSVRECAEWASEYLEKLRPDMPEISVTAFEDAEHKLCACVVNKDSNRELLARVPHRDIPGTDLSMIARFNLNNEMSFMITNTNYPHLNIGSVDKVMDMAVTNSAKDKFVCKGMNEVMADIMKTDGAPESLVKQIADGPDTLYVLTNDSKWQGAVALGFPDAIKKATDVIGEDKAYILPSSIHEILLIPESVGRDMGVEELKDMVSQVNTTQVQANEVLSNQVYFWDGKGVSIAGVKDRGKTTAKTEAKKTARCR